MIMPDYSVLPILLRTQENGIVLTGYGSGNSLQIERSSVIAAIAV
jgi:hypothetical protein